MAKVALVTILGDEDQGLNISSDIYTRSANLRMFSSSPEVSYEDYLKGLRQLGLSPSEIAMDLFVVACSLYAADTRLEREQFGEDSWTRIIDLYIPVSDPDLWTARKGLLTKIFQFLTGDIWDLNFRARTNIPIISPRNKRKVRAYYMPYITDTVCLFSGGMDSFIGAIDLLEKGIRPLLVGHAKSADVTPYQTKCAKALANHYPTLNPARIYAYVSIAKTGLFGTLDNTERGRSFLFLSLGAMCASSLSSNATLIVPENGMISLNLPLTPLRVGSHSTRTTHSHYLGMMQSLFLQLGLNVSLSNPYQFKTKGEMLQECSNSPLVASTETMSCSHPAAGRYQGGAGSSSRHCGYCVPCIIRKAAFKAANVQDWLPYGININGQPIKISEAPGRDVMAFNYMIRKVKTHPLYLTAAIRNTGPLGTDVQPYIEIYKRALYEVEELLTGVTLTT